MLEGDKPLADMVLIPAGTFEMGDSFGKGESVHTVTLSSFSMSKYETTYEKVSEKQRIDPSAPDSRRIQWLDSKIIVQQAQNRSTHCFLFFWCVLQVN